MEQKHFIQAKHGPESKLLQTSNREQSKALNSVYIRIAFPFFVEYNQSENQFKENLKMSNREDKNDLESFLRPVDKKSRPKASEKLRGAANFQSSQKMSISRGCKRN